MKEHKLTKQFQKELGKAGREQSKIIHKRIEKIVQLLRPQLHILKLEMQTGHWRLVVNPFDIQCQSDGEISAGEYGALEDYMRFIDDSTYTPVRQGPNQTKLLKELYELICFLLQEPYAEYLCCNFK